MIKIAKNNKGFTMIELIIAISIMSFGVVSVYSVFSSILSTLYSTSPRLTAVYLAKEGMEIIRNIRDDNFASGRQWRSGLSGCNSGCQADYKAGTEQEGLANRLKRYNENNFLMIGADGFYGYEQGDATLFKRKITIDYISNSSIKVNVEVMWDYKGKSYSFSTEGYLYNWY